MGKKSVALRLWDGVEDVDLQVGGDVAQFAVLAGRCRSGTKTLANDGRPAELSSIAVALISSNGAT